MIVGFYARVSTEEQRERQTIDAQVDYAKGRASLEGWDLRLFLDDGVSGTVALERRPAGAALLAAATAKEIDAVATYRLDRLGRTQLVILQAVETLKRLGVAYRSLTEPFDTGTAFGDAALGMVAVFAQLDRAVFLERSRAGTDRVAKQNGRWLGGIVPFAYVKRDDMTLGIDERPIPGLAESPADVVRGIFRACAELGWSTVRIAADLNARHIPTVYARDAREMLAGESHGTRARDGKRKRATACEWSPGAVLRILKNETYAGRHHYGKRSPSKRETIAREMPAIVSPALAEKARQQLTANSLWGRSHPRRDYPLRGLLTCTCHHTLIGQAYKGKGGQEVRVYRCHAHPKDSRATRVIAEEAERALWSDVLGFFERPDEVLKSIAAGTTDAASREDRAERELLTLAGELRELEAQEERALDAHLRQIFRPGVLERRLDALNASRDATQRRMVQVRSERANAAATASESLAVRQMLKDLAGRALSADSATRTQILRTLVRRTQVTWKGKATVLRVTYAFGAPAPVLAAMPSTNTGSSRQEGRNAPDRSPSRPRARS